MYIKFSDRLVVNFHLSGTVIWYNLINSYQFNVLIKNMFSFTDQNNYRKLHQQAHMLTHKQLKSNTSVSVFAGFKCQTYSQNKDMLVERPAHISCVEHSTTVLKITFSNAIDLCIFGRPVVVSNLQIQPHLLKINILFGVLIT